MECFKNKSGLNCNPKMKKTCAHYLIKVNLFQQTGTENESLAKLIFVELNNAWSDFENSGSQQQMFGS